MKPKAREGRSIVLHKESGLTVLRCDCRHKLAEITDAQELEIRCRCGADATIAVDLLGNRKVQS